jgi:ribonuclease R
MCAKGRQEITGRIQVHPKGYAFVTPSDGSGEADVYVPPSGVGGAVHGDEVVVRLRPRRGRRRPGRDRHEGVVVEVVLRERTSIVGKLLRYRDAVFLAPLDPRYPQAVRLQPEGTESVAHGRIVAARVVAEGRPGEPLLAEMTAELGEASDPETQ